MMTEIEKFNWARSMCPPTITEMVIFSCKSKCWYETRIGEQVNVGRFGTFAGYVINNKGEMIAPLGGDNCIDFYDLVTLEAWTEL